MQSVYLRVENLKKRILDMAKKEPISRDSCQLAYLRIAGKAYGLYFRLIDILQMDMPKENINDIENEVLNLEKEIENYCN